MLKFLKSGGHGGSSGSGTLGKPHGHDTADHHGHHGNGPASATTSTMVEVMRKAPAVGYPRKPTCLHVIPTPEGEGGAGTGYVILVGTATGVIKIVPFDPEHPTAGDGPLISVSVAGASGSASILKIISNSSSSDFHVLTTGNTLHQFDVRSGRLLREVDLGQKLSPISTFALSTRPEELIFLGTEVGNLYKLVKYGHSSSAGGGGAGAGSPGAAGTTGADEINSNNTQNIIYSEILTQNSPLSSKKPGPVEGLEYFQDADGGFLLIAFQRGLIVLWNVGNGTVLRHFFPITTSTADLEYLHLPSPAPVPGNLEFWTSYSDGSYFKWTIPLVATAIAPEGTVVPLTAPTSSATPYGPYPTLRIPKIFTTSSNGANGSKLTAFSGGLPKSEYGDKFSVSLLVDGVAGADDTHVTFDLPSKVVDFSLTPSHLFIATEEELIITDVGDDGSTSPVPTPPGLSCFHPSAVTCLFVASSTLFTGHEDGSIRRWNGSTLAPIGEPIHTREFFEETKSAPKEDPEDETEEDPEDDWPPFKKIGEFDPYSDDVRLSVKKLGLIGGNLLLVGGTAGQVIVIDLDGKPGGAGAVHTIHLSPKEFIWKGHEALTPVKGAIQMAQLSPPGGVTVLGGIGIRTGSHGAGSGEQILISIGSSHGYGIWNLTLNEIIFSKSTLVLELSDSGNEFSRRKSLKKSLRESFRRLRKSTGAAAGGVTGAGTAASSMPKERAIDEAIQGTKSELSGLVRLMEWTKGCILTVSTPSPMLIVGLHSGLIQILTLHLLGTTGTPTPSIKLSKEIQLKHAAPVISTYIIDGIGRPIQWNGNFESLIPPSPSPMPPLPHRLLLLSEEQIKFFTLPTLRPWGNKLKVTAHEGIRMKKSIVVTPGTTSPEFPQQNGIRILLNNGAVRGIRGGLHMDLKRGAIGDFRGVVPEGDLSALTSFIFSSSNQSYYMSSSSEIQKVEWTWDNQPISPSQPQQPKLVKSHHKRTSSSDGHHGPPPSSVLSTVIEENCTGGAGCAGGGSPDTTIDEVRDHTSILSNNSMVVTTTTTSNGGTGIGAGASMATATTEAAEEANPSPQRPIVSVTTTTASTIVTSTAVIETLIN